MIPDFKTILKFFPSKNHVGNYSLISRTMGKISIPSRAPDLTKSPFWKCRIISEKNHGSPSGYFIVEPLEPIDPLSIRKLIAGFFKLEEEGSHLFFLPLIEPEANWILHKDTKAAFSRKGCSTIVPCQDLNF